MAEAVNAGFPILADVDHRVAEAYGVFDRFGDRVAAPSVWIIDEDGRIVWRHIGTYPDDRPYVEEIWRHLP